MALTLTYLATSCAFCCYIIYFVKWYLRRRRLRELASRFKGPLALPIIGNAHLFLGNNEYLLNQLCKIVQSYPSPCRLWLGPLFHLHVTDPEQIKTICLSPKTMGKGKEMKDFCRVLVGDGLLMAPVSKWKVHRKLIQPTFNAKILESFVEVFATQSKILTQKMERNLDGPEFKVFDLVSLCTLDMICETAMGVKVGAQANENSYFAEALKHTLDVMIKRFFLIWLQPDFIFYRTKFGKDERKYIKYLHDFVQDVIQMKKKELLEREMQPAAAEIEDNLNGSTPRREGFSDLLMKQTYNDGNLSNEELRDEVMTMVLAGHETNATTLCYVILMLASHPDVQDMVYQELYEIYGNTNSDERPVRPKDLTLMKYLERVIKETMRLFPAAPYILREVTEELNIGEYVLPTEGTIAIAILGLHRNEKYWPDPLKFDPDRFLPEENAKRHPYAYMAFSGGPRNCVGSNYAMMSMKTLMATVLREYVLKKDDIVPITDIRLRLQTLLKPVNPIAIRIQRRTRN